MRRTQPAWAREFAGRFRTSADEFHRFAAPHIARMAVEAIAEASVPDPDERLYDLLAAVIDECAAMMALSRIGDHSTTRPHRLESLN